MTFTPHVSSFYRDTISYLASYLAFDSLRSIHTSLELAYVIYFFSTKFVHN